MRLMPRPTSSERLLEIARVATEDFGRLGYRGTKTADVAARAGMSTGALFTYVESKEALFHLVFLHWFGMSAERPPVLPVPTPGPGETLAVIEAGLRDVQMPRIRAALAEEEPADVAEELREIVAERYALIEHYWPLLAVIERCAVEMPELESAWFDMARAGSFEQLGSYLERRMAAGLLRPMPDSEVAARIVTETLLWFGWHRHEGRDSALYKDETVRRTVIEFIAPLSFRKHDRQDTPQEARHESARQHRRQPASRASSDDCHDRRPGAAALGVPPDRVPVLVWVIAAIFVAAELAVSGRYGFQQDELYFIVAGHHLAFGYVDQPPLAPLLTRITGILGVSPTAIRIIPALAGGAIVIMAARLAALFGAGRFGRVLAALTTACAPSSSAPCMSATPRRWTCSPGQRSCSASARHCYGVGRAGGLRRAPRLVSGSRPTTWWPCC